MNFYGHRIGETPFYQESALRDRISDIKKSGSGVPVFYVKDDADNPSGSHKARVVAPAIKRWSDKGDVILARITEGGFTETFGYLSRFAPGNVSFASVVDYSMPVSEVKRLRRYGPVIRTDLDAGGLSSSRIADMVRKKAGRRNATVVPLDNLDSNGEGYESIGTELFDSGVRKEWTLYMPVGGANTAVGVTRGFRKKGEVPRMKWATIPGNLFSDELGNGHGSDTHLHARYSQVEREARSIMAEHDVEVVTIYDGECEEALEVLKNVGLRSSPTSAVPWAAVERYAREVGFKEDEKIVFLNTGYQVPPDAATSTPWMRYAAMFATAATLLPVSASVIVPKDAPQAVVDDRWTRQALDNERRELVGNPTRAQIEAFALYKGGIEKLGDGRIVNVPNKQIKNDLDYWYFSNDMIARDMYKRGGRFAKTIDEFREWSVISRILSMPESERSSGNERYLRERLEIAVRHRTGGGPDSRLPESGRFMLDYLDRDPYLNDKIAFAFDKTRGSVNEEFVQIVSDLHYPGYGNVESMICRSTPRCMGTHREFDEWQKKQKEGWDKMAVPNR